MFVKNMVSLAGNNLADVWWFDGEMPALGSDI